MESLLDEVDSLIAPALSTDTPEWCSNCQTLRQEIKRLQEEQLQNFGKLKQKIISTDLLIKKYKSKCDDHDFQCKRAEEANKRADKFQRQCEILETQLKAALMDTEPLRKTKTTMEAEIRLKNAEIQSISDRLLAAEGAQRQYEHLTKASSNDIDKLETDKKELQAKIKMLESGKLSKEASKEYRHEISVLKKEKAAMMKNEKRLEGKLSGALARIEHLTNIIKEKKFSPKRQRRTSSGNRSSPLKSPGRSPRGDNKASPVGRGRARTLSERSAASQNMDGTPAQKVEKLASSTESSSDDSDDAGSMCSMSWTFSPLMKCLSPLPPSPACVRERKLNKGQHSVETEEEEAEAEVSDIAEELEQQLLQEEEPVGESNSDGTKTHNSETMEDTKQSTGNTKPIIGDDEISEETSKLPDDVKEISKHSDEQREEVKKELKNSVQEIKTNDKFLEKEKLTETLPTVEPSQPSLKEKLANSIEIVSPTAVRQRIAHQPNNTKYTIKCTDSNEHGTKAAFENSSENVKISASSKGRIPPVRRSARIKSLKEGEISETELDINEPKMNESTDTNKTKSGISEFNRNDTEEFTPTMCEHTENLSDSEMEVESANIQKNVPKSKQDTFSDTVAALDKSITYSDVSSLNENEINVNTNHKNIISTGSSEIKKRNNEEQIKIWKEEQKVKICPVPVPKSCLQRQDVVNEEPTKLYKDIKILKSKVEHKDVKKQVRSKFTSDKFINFQKSSSGTLSNEMEDFSYLDDYKVLSRDDKASRMFSPRTEIKPSLKKNLKRRMKRTCKYRDRDSEYNRDNKEIISGDQSHDTCAQRSNISIEKDKVKESHKEILKAVNENLNLAEVMINKEITGEQTETSENLKLYSQSQESKISPGLLSGTGTKTLSIKEETLAAKHVLRSQKMHDGDKQEHNPESISKTDLGVKNSIESKIDINRPGTACITIENKDSSLTESGYNEIDKKNLSDKDNCGILDVNVELEASGLGSCQEREAPARQMSTGFTVNSPYLERASSTESTKSFRSSPSRLVHLESGHYDTIVEEEAGEEFDKDDKNKGSYKDSESKGIHDTGFIFGVEDLLDVGKAKDPIAVQLGTETVQNAVKPFCDKNAISANMEMAVLDRNKPKTDILSVAALDEEYNKPGCSYHYHEITDQSTSHEVSIITTVVKSASKDGKLQFVTDVSQEDESSLSRCSTPSFDSINRTSPVSPLSFSPFNFLDPVSPLPPSPVKEMERVSPLSPEHLGEEQKSMFDIHESEDTGKDNPVIKDLVTVNVDLSEKEACAEKPEFVVDRNCTGTLQDKVSNIVSKKENESIKLKNNKGQTAKNLITSDKGKRKCDNAKGTTKKNLPKESGTSKYATLNVDSLELFPLPQLISPVKTPKSQSKVKLKAEQMKASASEKQIAVDDEDKTEKFDPENSQEKHSNKPKQFLTKAPESAIAVKPRISRSMGSLEIPNVEICVRKSSRTAIKRVASINKTDAATTKKLSVDGKHAFVEKAIVCKKAAEISNSDKVKGTKTCKDVLNVEEGIMMNNENSNEQNVTDYVDEKGDNIEEWSAGHDNLAFKRKTRVAHKPNIHPLKTHKIQIIDAPRLPPVTVGRKRKSLDNINKEGQDKKQCKENLFQKQKSAPVDADVNKDDTRKMQGFLKSAESAESFVSRFSMEVCDHDTDLKLLKVSLECLGRVRTDTLEVVYRICESGQYLTINVQFPFLSDVDKKAVQLFQYLLTKMKTDGSVVMRKIWDCVFSRDISANIVGKMAQCRVFIALCTIQGDLELARALFYHLVTCGHMNYSLFIVSVVSVWPDVLKKDLLDRPDKVVSHGMTLVLEEIITNMLLSQESEANNKILLILKKMCNWSGKSGNASTILKSLCSRLMTILDEESVDKSAGVELTKALELLCTSQKWEWCKEQFIMRYGLQTAANKYLAEKIHKPVPPDYVCAILQLTSRCMNSLSTSIKGKDYQLIIKNWLIPILSHKPGNEKVRQCCLETLLELSPLYITCLDSIQKWFVEEKDSVSQELAARLEDLRLQYKQKFGLQCKPFLEK